MTTQPAQTILLTGSSSGIKEAPAFCVVPLCFTALGCIVLFFFADEIYRLLTPLGAR